MTTQPGTTAAAYMDEAMKAIALAKQALLGGAGGALFVSTAPDLAAAEASPGNPYGSSVPLASLRDREHYDAGSAAGGAEPCVIADGHEGAHRDASGHEWDGEPAEHHCPATGLESYRCTLRAGHAGPHEAEDASPLPTWYDDENGPDGDAELDAALAAADDELLAVIKRHVDPAKGLAQITADNDELAAREPICRADNDGWTCTEPPGHDGNHVALGADQEHARWPQQRGPKIIPVRPHGVTP